MGVGHSQSAGPERRIDRGLTDRRVRRGAPFSQTTTVAELENRHRKS